MQTIRGEWQTGNDPLLVIGLAPGAAIGLCALSIELIPTVVRRAM
jgi:hypothetical protein